MDIDALKNTIQQLLSGQKGLLAMDESTPTCNKRFELLDIPQTMDYRNKYRELIVTTPGLEAYISGAILVDETITQRSAAGELFTAILTRKGIIIGIKVDQGTGPMDGYPGEKLTAGFDGLAERLDNYYRLGARFAKWRAVITISENTPTATNIRANADLLARYASLCQEAGLVPIVESEILMDGDHTLQQCADATSQVLHAVFNSLYDHKVHFEGMILKPNMVVPGIRSAVQGSADAIAEATVECFLRCVPAAIPGIAFLSGGQPAELATARLNAMHLRFKNKMPWVLTFSFSRAVQQPALEFWKGEDRNIPGAQQRLLHRVDLNSVALTGRYTAGMENTLYGSF